MAESAIPDTQSLSAGSETLFDIVCQPCSSEGKNVEAESYCQDCCEHLCAQCTVCHKKLSVSKHHTLLSKESMPRKQDTPSVRDVCTERCQNHKDKIIEYYCPTHKVLGCTVCVTLKHKLCEDVAYIPEVVTDIEDSADYKEFKAKLEDMIQNSIDTAKFAEESKKRSSDCQSKAIQEIEAYRQEIIDAVDRQVNEMKERARQIKAQDTDRMNTLVDKSNQVLVELKSMSSELSTPLNNKQYCQVFVEMKIKEQNLTELQGKLEDIDGAEISDYKFQPDEELRTMVKREGSLGKLLVKSTDKTASSTKGGSQNEGNKCEPTVAPRDIKQIKATHVADINVKSDSSTNNCSISGVAYFSTDKLVVADWRNGTLKLVDTSNNRIISELKTEKKSWDVSVSRDKIVATLPKASKILFLKYDKGLVHDRDVSVNGQCRSIACSDDKLFVTFDKEKKLEVMTMSGVVLQRFDTNDQGGQLFEDPTYVTVSTTHQSIYVSEWEKGQVKILGMDGKLKSVYEESELAYPRQLAVDKDGAIYLCDQGKSTIHLLSPQHTKVKILLTNQDGVRSPTSVCYCENTGRMYVGMNSNNTIKVYQVS